VVVAAALMVDAKVLDVQVVLHWIASAVNIVAEHAAASLEAAGAVFDIA
jgi:CheY-specific phosphatase CheX